MRLAIDPLDGLGRLASLGQRPLLFAGGRIGFHGTLLEQFGVVVSDFVSKIRDLVATLFELTTDQVELIEYRILDLNAYVRR